MNKSTAATETKLKEFYEEADRRHLIPLWKVTARLLTPEPQTKVIPYLWRWADLRRMAYRAGELVPIERGGERRVLGLVNPGLGGKHHETPVMKALGLYREEAYRENDGHQKVTAVFET